MGMSVGGKGGSMANINITPYIDILLVLLIIFMVITPIVQRDIEVKVPQSSGDNGPAVPDLSIIVVSISDTAQIAINGLDQTLQQLGTELQRIYSERSNKSMFISAGAKLPYGDVVRVIDIAKGAGVGDIGLVLEEIN
jgi:biopolymer transport protein ExbD